MKKLSKKKIDVQNALILLSKDLEGLRNDFQVKSIYFDNTFGKKIKELYKKEKINLALILLDSFLICVLAAVLYFK